MDNELLEAICLVYGAESAPYAGVMKSMKGQPRGARLNALADLALEKATHANSLKTISDTEVRRMTRGGSPASQSTRLAEGRESPVERTLVDRRADSKTRMANFVRTLKMRNAREKMTDNFYRKHDDLDALAGQHGYDVSDEGDNSDESDHSALLSQLSQAMQRDPELVEYLQSLVHQQ